MCVRVCVLGFEGRRGVRSGVVCEDYTAFVISQRGFIAAGEVTP